MTLSTISENNHKDMKQTRPFLAKNKRQSIFKKMYKNYEEDNLIQAQNQRATLASPEQKP